MTRLEKGSPAVKKAIQWISREKESNPDKKTNNLIEIAIFRFDLSPADSEFLYRFFKNNPGPKSL